MTAADWIVTIADEWAAPAALVLPPAEADRPVVGAAALLAAGQTGAAMRAAAVALEDARLSRQGDQGLLALGIGWVAEVRHFNFVPGGCGLGAPDLKNRWEGVERSIQLMARAAEYQALPGGKEAGAVWRWLEFAASRPSAGATARNARGTRFQEQMLEMLVRQCELARADARTLPPAAPGFIERAIAVLWRHAGLRERALEQLGAAAMVCKAAGDDVGVAICQAMACDWRAATWSSAQARNLEVDEANWPTSQLSWTIEALEGQPGEVDASAIEARIADAEVLAQRTGAKRVLGLLALCKGELARLKRSAAEQLAQTDVALSFFEAAGDAMHAQLARTHGLLARIDADAGLENTDSAAAIGRWGAGEGSFSYAFGLGLMMTRAASQALQRDGDYERAQAALQSALALNQALGADFRVAQTLADLAALGRAIGHRARALSFQGQALDRLTAIPDRWPAAGAEAGQRLSLLLNDAWQEALDHRDAQGMNAVIDRMVGLGGPDASPVGAAIRTLLESTHQQSTVLVPLYRGIEARNGGDQDAADALFDQALLAAQAIPSAEGEFLAAAVLATRGRHDDAVLAYDRYQAADKATAGATGMLQAVLQEMGGERAQQELLKARERKVGLYFAFMVRAHAYARAETALTELQALAGDDWYLKDQRPWRALSDVGEMYEGLGKLDEALSCYEAAIDALEERRALLSRDELKTALSADFGAQYLYFQAVRTALRQVDQRAGSPLSGRAAEAAFRISEQGRARGLLDLMSSNLRMSEGIEAPALQAWRERATRAELLRGLLAQARVAGDSGRVHDLEQRTQEAEDALRAAGHVLAEQQPELAKIMGITAEQIELEQAAAQLPPGTAMLQYMTLGDELLLWAITARGLESASVVPLRASILARKVRDFAVGCADGDPLEGLIPQAEGLSDDLLEPLRDVIEKHERLVIVPYGELFKLPFAALRWEGDWLAARRTLTQLPSASVMGTLAAMRQKAPPGPRVALAVGDPEAMSYSSLEADLVELCPLPGAQAEARYVAQALGGTALVGAEATKQAVIGAFGSHNIFHFATHGLAFDEAPLLSGVALAHGEVLTVQELLASRFRAELVTLSACDTGRGVLTAGQELVGLSRGLLAAGAQSIVVSLWPLEDLATAVLMSRFADALAQGEEPVVALHRSQARMRTLEGAAGNHPQRWAAFVMIGI